MKPAPIQRRAPLTVMPTCGTLTASTSTKDAASSTGVTRWISSRPPRERTRMTTRPIDP
jgi:hypothetical protein